MTPYKDRDPPYENRDPDARTRTPQRPPKRTKTPQELPARTGTPWEDRVCSVRMGTPKVSPMRPAAPAAVWPRRLPAPFHSQKGTSESRQGERAIKYDFKNALGAAVQRQVSKQTCPQEEILPGLVRPSKNKE